MGLTSQSSCDIKRREKVGEVEGLLKQTGARPQNFQTWILQPQGLAVLFLGPAGCSLPLWPVSDLFYFL